MFLINNGIVNGRAGMQRLAEEHTMPESKIGVGEIDKSAAYV